MNTNNTDHDMDDGEVLDGDVLEPISRGALATIHRVEVDQQVATAKQYPRNVTEIKQSLTSLCTMDEDTAEECIYALPRGNKVIRGPSARFADCLISFWGNARSDSYVTEVNVNEGYVEAVGAFQDVERNVIRRRRTRRRILDRNGKVYNADMILMTGNAACTIAERNAILNGIPKPLWTTAYERAFALVAGTLQTLDEKRARAFKAFMVHGIEQKLVLEKLGRQDESKVVLDDIVTMRGMLTALKTGEETVDTIFGRGAVGPQHQTVQNPLKDEPAQQQGGATETRQQPSQGQQSTAQRQDPISSGPANEPRQEQRHNTDATSYRREERTETASTEGAKSDNPPGEAQKPVQVAGDKPAAEQPAAEKPAAAASSLNDRPYRDGGGYIEFMHDQFDAATSKAAVKDVWSSTRADRQEMLDAEQVADLTKDKDAALRKFDLKGQLS